MDTPPPCGRDGTKARDSADRTCLHIASVLPCIAAMLFPILLITTLPAHTSYGEGGGGIGGGDVAGVVVAVAAPAAANENETVELLSPPTP